jgi:hypothetical protein
MGCGWPALGGALRAGWDGGTARGLRWHSLRTDSEGKGVRCWEEWAGRDESEDTERTLAQQGGLHCTRDVAGRGEG